MSVVKDQVILKSLQTRLEKERAEVSVWQKQLNEIREKVKVHQNRYTSIKRQIDEMTKDELIVTEHAIIQFQRRVELLSPEEVEQRIVTEEFKRIWRITGGGTIPVGDTGASAIIKGNIITTIII